MTRSELTSHLRTLSSGTIAHAIGCASYSVIDRSVSSAILYAIEQASDDEIKPLSGLEGVLSFLSAHKDYNPSWCG
jgi:DNA-binding PucR family transcriptional regulator